MRDAINSGRVQEAIKNKGVRNEMTKDQVFESAVEQAAKSQGAFFFTKNGEGREFETETMAGEDLFGWLIPLEDADTFRSELRNQSISDRWDDFLCFALWRAEDENISISFVHF